MKKSVNWLKIVTGSVSSLAGALGTLIVVACPCKMAALSAITVAIFGAGAAAFLQKYSYVFIILGVVLLAWGIFSIIMSKRKRKRCCCDGTD